MTLLGTGTANDAVYFQGESRLEVVNCTISDFPNAGIRVSPNAAKTVLISHTSVTDTVTGIFLQPLGGAMSAMLNRVTTNHDGIGIILNVGVVRASLESMITDSHFDNNANIGIDGTGVASNSINAVFENVTLNQDPTGINLNGFSSIWLSQVTQTSMSGFVNTAVAFQNSGNSALSDGTNHLMGTITGGVVGGWSSN